MSYKALAEAIGWAANSIQPGHPCHNDVHDVANLPARTWTPETARHAWQLITGPLADPLRADGWDLDLLACPQIAPTIRVCDHDTDTIAIDATTEWDTSAISGVAFDPGQRHWTAPKTARVAYTLTRLGADFDPAVAFPPPVDEITITSDGLWSITGPRSGAVDTLLRDIPYAHTATRTQHAWTHSDIPSDILDELTARHGYQLAPEAQAADMNRRGPLVFDGTIDGLRGVPVSDLSTLYDKQRKALTACGFVNIYDLLHHIPRRYVDRSQPRPINLLTPKQTATTVATVSHIGQYDFRQRRGRITLTDSTGEISCTYFNDPSPFKKLKKNDDVLVHGRLDVWQRSPASAPVLQMANPMIEPIGGDDSPFLPVYAQSPKKRLTSADLGRAIQESLSRLPALTDPVPDSILSELRLPTRLEAYRRVHRPHDLAQGETGRKRLAFDELFRLQLALGMHRKTLESAAGIAHSPTGVLRGYLRERFSYSLTGGQTKAIQDITQDMAKPTPMLRLLQGDVGAGKSSVALAAAATAIDAGHQVAVMAPTEVLARQLHADFTASLASRNPDEPDIQVAYLGNATGKRDRTRTLKGLTSGAVNVAVGTHALLSETVTFASLGLAIIDEQHRFGVDQRAALTTKGPHGAIPDLLIMSATPIPRTAAMTVYGDLDISLLTELPPGRHPVQTHWIDTDIDLDDPAGAPWAAVRQGAQNGHQAFIVCALVDDSETLSAKAASSTADHLRNGALAGLRIGLVHGKLAPAERDTTMTEFVNGELDALVATTVIEVGVNVPNASVMVVLDPARFGLAQLHQLRGRVGRGQVASQCWLYGPAASADASLRMETMCTTSDGFKIAEVDLAMRGTGQLLGTAQSGDSDITVADFGRDADLIAAARAHAHALLAADPTLARRPGLAAEVANRLGVNAGTKLQRT